MSKKGKKIIEDKVCNVKTDVEKLRYRNVLSKTDNRTKLYEKIE